MQRGLFKLSQYRKIEDRQIPAQLGLCKDKKCDNVIQGSTVCLGLKVSLYVFVEKGPCKRATKANNTLQKAQQCISEWPKGALQKGQKWNHSLVEGPAVPCRRANSALQKGQQCPVEGPTVPCRRATSALQKGPECSVEGQICLHRRVKTMHSQTIKIIQCIAVIQLSCNCHAVVIQLSLICTIVIQLSYNCHAVSELSCNVC